uniref:Uncharacterized protein n=1 Tax=Acrobeloides nanus TaxID=290746 RepID=A0A914CKZ4_9BILA
MGATPRTGFKAQSFTAFDRSISGSLKKNALQSRRHMVYDVGGRSLPFWSMNLLKMRRNGPFSLDLDHNISFIDVLTLSLKLANEPLLAMYSL